MDAKLQGYIDKLNALNFKDMYNGDFFLTWEKSDDEIEAVQKYLRAGLESLCSVTTPHVHVSLSLLLVTCLVWKFRIWMRENLRLHTAKLFVKQQT